MKFIVEKRDGPARVGELLIKDERVITPNILFVDSNRFKAPDFSDLLITNEEKTTCKPILNIFGSMFLPSKEKKDEKLQVSNYFFYPKDLSKELLDKYKSISGIMGQKLYDIAQIEGLGDVRVVRIAAALEVVHRITKALERE